MAGAGVVTMTVAYKETSGVARNHMGLMPRLGILSGKLAGAT